MKVTGNCFEAAFKMLLEADEDAVLVHAEVEGQGRLEGVRFGHAFVQSGETVYDNTNGRGVVMHAAMYRLLGGIDSIGNTHTYTRKQAVEKALTYGHYGPWDLQTSTGL